MAGIVFGCRIPSRPTAERGGRSPCPTAARHDVVIRVIGGSPSPRHVRSPTPGPFVVGMAGPDRRGRAVLISDLAGSEAGRHGEPADEAPRPVGACAARSTAAQRRLAGLRGGIIADDDDCSDCRCGGDRPCGCGENGLDAGSQRCQTWDAEHWMHLSSPLVVTSSNIVDVSPIPRADRCFLEAGSVLPWMRLWFIDASKPPPEPRPE